MGDRRIASSATAAAMITLVVVAAVSEARAQRPSPGDGYDEEAILESFTVAESPVRIWYVRTGADAPPLADEDPADGVPDFVAAAEEVARISLQRFAELGFRAPLVDAAYLPPSEAGGDGALDIYLMDMLNADGSFQVEGCVAGTRTCYGFAIVENDFAGFAYPSPLLGQKTVICHELFHAVQNAYDNQQDSRWTEGSAVWAEEIVFPEQDDFERFIAAFLEKPTRPFDRTTGAAFGDPYPYGAALWPTFLAERYGEGFVREIWEGSAENEGRAADFLAVTAALLESRGESLADEFEEFTRWNLFTAERADAARAYQRGADWPSVALEELVGASKLGDLQTEGLSASYHPLDLRGIDGPTELRLIETIAPLPRATLFSITSIAGGALGGALGEPVPLVALKDGVIAIRLDLVPTDEAILVVSGVAPGTPMRAVRAELGPPLAPEGDLGGCQASGSGRGGAALACLALLALGWRRRRAAAGLALVVITVVTPGAIVVAQPNEVPSEPDETESVVDGSDEVIVITGSRHETPLSDAVVATEVISAADIENSGASTLAELLASHPGLEVAPTFRGSEVRMQGLDPEYVLLLVDGNRAIGRIGGAIDLERYAIEDVERIEIVKGASSALYGSDALAGVINIITKRPSAPIEAEADARTGSFRELDLSGRVGAKRARWSAAIGGGFHRSDGFDRMPETEATTASAYREGTGNAAAAWSVSDALELSMSLELLRRDLDGVDLGSGGAVFDRQSITEETSVSTRLRWADRARPSNKLTLTAQGSQFRDQLLIDQRGADDLDSFEKTRERLGRLEGTWNQLIGDHLVVGGVELLGETLDADRLSEPGSRVRVSAFGQDEWLVAPSLPLVVSPGLRIDVDSQFGARVSPKLASRWDAREGLVVRMSGGLGYRAPDFRELLLIFENPGVGYVVEGNPDLEPETSLGVSANVEAKLRADVWLSLGAFENRIEDLISIDLIDAGGAGTPQRFTYVNVASARSRGIESLLKLRRRLGAAHSNLDVGYTLTDTRDNDAGHALPGRARHRVTVSGAIRVGRLNASLRGAFVGVRRFYSDSDGDGADETLSTDPYATLDGRLSLRITNRFAGYGGVANVTDAGDGELMPLPPRAFYLGLKANY